MWEIRTPGLMSGDGKRDHELYAQSTRAHPRLYFGPGTVAVYRVAPRIVRIYNLRRFSPSFFEHIPLRAAAGHSGDLLAAVEVLRAMNRDGGRKLSREAPTRFLTPALRAIVESENGLDRRAYECAVVVAVRDELRRGNLWVEGSRRYRQLTDFFLPEPEWTARRADFFSRARLPAKAEDGGRFLARRLAAAYDRFQSRFPENAQVKVTEDGWRLSSDVAERRSPEEQQALERLTSWMGAHMRSIRLPDLLIEVDNELDWSRHFIPPSRRRERSVQDICEVVASVMAYGCNIGPETMARVTNDVSYKAIRRLADWQFSEDKLRVALADLVNGISRCDAAEVWGHARTSSSDGQRYLFPRKTLKATYSHRLGDYALEFYTFVADNYAPFYSTPIECTERDAAYVLDGLLYHESEVDPEEHYTDTHGYTELNFAAFAMFGKRFCPRIRGLHRQWIYRIDPDKDYGPRGQPEGTNDPPRLDHRALGQDRTVLRGVRERPDHRVCRTQASGRPWAEESLLPSDPRARAVVGSGQRRLSHSPPPPRRVARGAPRRQRDRGGPAAALEASERRAPSRQACPGEKPRCSGSTPRPQTPL